MDVLRVRGQRQKFEMIFPCQVLSSESRKRKRPTRKSRPNWKGLIAGAHDSVFSVLVYWRELTNCSSCCLSLIHWFGGKNNSLLSFKSWGKAAYIHNIVGPIMQPSPSFYPNSWHRLRPLNMGKHTCAWTGLVHESRILQLANQRAP